MSCDVKIKRLTAAGLALETVYGWGWTPKVYIPFDTFDVKPIVETDSDEAAFWRIEKTAWKDVIKTMTEITLWGDVRDTSFWYILKWLLPNETVIDNWDWTWSHTFSTKNDNCNQSFAILDLNGIDNKYCNWAILDSLDIDMSVPNAVSFSAKFKWKTLAPAWVAPTPFYNDIEKRFKSAKSSLKIANNVAWLASATSIWFNTSKLSIWKWAMEVQEGWYQTVDVAKIYNTVQTITWDIEALFKDATLRQYVLDWTPKAIQYIITWENMDWEQTQFEILLDEVYFDDWGSSTDNDGFITQSVWFEAVYSRANEKSITMALKNSKTNAY